MLTLTRILLHNWHRFHHHVIDVEDSLYLAGHNGSGKSSVLDAIQLVLIADQQRVRFNSSAQDRSQRNLDSYVRGKIGEGRLLRPGNTVAYIALQFTDKSKDTHITVGVCIEAGHDKAPERTFFILTEALDPQLLIEAGRPRPRRELRALLRQRRGAQSFDHVGEYQEELLNKLGGLNQRFSDLFLRALTFQPIRNIRDFVEQWLLEASPLNVETLQRVKDRLSELRSHAQEVEERLVALNEIVGRQAEVLRLRERYTVHTVLGALLHVAAVRQRIAGLNAHLVQLARQIEQCEQERMQVQAALAGAEDALLEAQVRLRQSDIIRRRDELQAELQRVMEAANAVRSRWTTLQQELVSEARQLQPLLAALHHPERDAPTALVAAIEALVLDMPPPPTFTTVVETAVTALDTARTRVEEQRFEIERQLKLLGERRATLHDELTRLLDPRSRPTYPREVERLRELLTPVVSTRPPLLCELLEVPDERWHDAVEAMLGQRRFTVIVPPERFDAALHELDRARAQERLFDVGLLDLAKAQTELRAPKPNSLASKVETQVRALRLYIDAILGDIITCESVAELRQYRRAITPDVVVYSEWTARAVPPRRFQPWFIGQQARQSQIEVRQRELETVNAEISCLEPQAREVRALVAGLERGRRFERLRDRLDGSLDERPLRARMAEVQSELHALDLSGIEALQREVERLAELAAHERAAERRLFEQNTAWKIEHRGIEAELQVAQRQLVEREAQAAEVSSRYQAAVSAAEGLLAERATQPDLEELIRNAESTARNFETRAANETQRLSADSAAYNIKYQFVAHAGNPDDPSYANEQQRLTATELPQYKEQITLYEQQAEEELREHVLHRMREQMLNAKQQLGQINDALNKLQFHGERYQFRWYAADEVKEYYDLINDAQLLGPGSLYESQFYRDHCATFERFYDALTRTPQSEAERREQERLTDYRRYLSYDIEVTHADGQTSRLSRIMGHTSGGETQTPFYLTIAASFVQLYRINERSSRPTIRLVAFDEAFSKMDQDRIGSTLELFQQFKLQIITATPLERCEYLVPKMCTSLVLTGVGDSVLIEPYRNYAAKLEVFDGV